MREVVIQVPSVDAGHYSVIIGQDLLGTVIDDVRDRMPDRTAFVVTDANLAASGHLDSLVGDHEVRSFVIDPPGEVSKHIGTVQQVITAMEKDALGRDTVLLALGGGTVGDLGGFAAAIFKRGIPYVQIPTTTVAQADSAVGGKVGVDSELSKNAYGAFKQPSRVYADVLTLTSLADRHFRAGLVESVKHALIADADYFEFFEANLDRMLAREFGVLTEIAEKNVRIKGSVVEQDPQESGRRKILNYGHTIGHAVESASGFALLHGEAVAIGILAAGRIAEELGLLSPEVHGRVVRIWQALGMPTAIPANLASQQLAEIMTRDKKAVGGKPRFVLIEEVGTIHGPRGQYAVPVEPALVEKVIAGLRAI